MLEFISEVEPENSIEVDFGGRERSNSFVNILFALFWFSVLQFLPL